MEKRPMLKIKADKMFFDRKAIRDLVGDKAAAQLSKAGAFVRRTARTSMKKAGKRARANRAATGLGTPSPPGSPPKVWATDDRVSLRNIQFSFDPQSWSVFVGPIRLNGRTAMVPKLMEHGGVVRRSRKDREIIAAKINRLNALGRDIKGKFRKKSAAEIKPESIQSTTAYAPRPFMGPALVKEAPKFPSLFGRSA